jgi:THO complex subunit 2
MEAADAEMLEYCGLTLSTKQWRQREVRANTKALYVQRKFNLLREEGEGYAKVVTLLNQRGAGALTEGTLDHVIEEIQALVGFFDLDPNRVCALAIQAFACQPDNHAFLRLIPSFSPQATAQLLGFAFGGGGRGEAGVMAAATPTTTPTTTALLAAPSAVRPRTLPGLYSAAARLVGSGCVSLEALLSHLSPSDQELSTAWQAGQQAMKDDVDRIGIIDLTAGSKDASADRQAQRSKAGQSAATLELDPLTFSRHLASALGPDNQKLGLLAAMLRAGHWVHAQRLMQWMAALGLADFGLLPGVGPALCAFIAAELEPAYAAVHPGGALIDMVEVRAPGTDVPVSSCRLGDGAFFMLRLCSPVLCNVFQMFLP